MTLSQCVIHTVLFGSSDLCNSTSDLFITSLSAKGSSRQPLVLFSTMNYFLRLAARSETLCCSSNVALLRATPIVLDRSTTAVSEATARLLTQVHL